VDEITVRGALTIAGGYSGDDAYDPAADATPELSLPPYTGDLSAAADCGPVASQK